MNVTDPQERRYVRVVRLGRERVPQEHHQVNLAACYKPSNLEVAALGPGKHAFDLEPGLFRDLAAGRARRHQLAFPERIFMIAREHYDIDLLGVVGYQLS